MDDQPFVAREHELNQLQQRLVLSLQGQGQVALIAGDAGSGKTAMVNHFVQRSQRANQELLSAIGTCDAQTGVGDPYLPLREILSILTAGPVGNMAESATSEENASRLQSFLRFSGKAVVEIAPDLVGLFIPGAGLATRVGIFVADQVGWLDLLESLVDQQPAAPGELDQEHIFEQVTRLLQVLAAEQPLLLILDDLQWADRASLALFFHLARRIGESRILLVGAFRPDEVALGRNGERHPLEKILAEIKRYLGDVEVDLDKASSERGQFFVDALLDLEFGGLRESFRRALFQHTGGHPLFTVELLRDLQERGYIIRGDEGWFEASDIAWGELPPRVEGVIEERINRLENDLLDILTVASVEGEAFTAQVIARVEELRERRLLRSLSQQLAKRHRLVLEQEEVKVGQLVLSRFQFSHSLIQRFLYDDLGAGERRLLHLEVAAALEALYAGRVEEVAVQLARHYTEANEQEKAIDYLLQAGDRARMLYAYQEAIEYYERALVFLKEGRSYERTARTLMKLGLTYHIAFDFDRARQAYQEGFALWGYVVDVPVSLPSAFHPLRVDWPYPPVSLDPAMAADVDTSGVVDQLFCGLVSLSADMEVIPDVARSWEVQADGSEYVFHLRDDVQWSDGMPVTAGDFVYAWRRVLDPATRSPVAGLLYDVLGARAYHQGESDDPESVGARVLNDTTLVITLESPTSYFLYLLTYNASYAVPRHRVEELGAGWAAAESITTNGPFLLDSWDEERLSFTRYGDYHGRVTGNVGWLELVTLPDGPARLTAYENGELDLLFMLGLGPERDRARQRYAGEYISAPSLMTTMIGLNARRPPFDDPRVRCAFAQSFDKELFADVKAGGYVFPATGGFVPPGMPGHLPGIGLPFDPERARDLLARAGYSDRVDFPPITFLVEESNEFPVRFLAEEWKRNLGVEVQIEVCDLEAFFQRLETEPPAGFPITWIADYPDPDTFLRGCDAVRWTGWQDSSYDRLVDKAMRLTDQGQRMAYYRQAEERLIRGAAIIPLTYGRSHMLVKPWVRNLPVSALRWWYWMDAVIESHRDTIENEV